MTDRIDEEGEQPPLLLLVVSVPQEIFNPEIENEIVEAIGKEYLDGVGHGLHRDIFCYFPDSESRADAEQRLQKFGNAIMVSHTLENTMPWPYDGETKN